MVGRHDLVMVRLHMYDLTVTESYMIVIFTTYVKGGWILAQYEAPIDTVFSSRSEACSWSHSTPPSLATISEARAWSISEGKLMLHR